MSKQVIVVVDDEQSFCDVVGEILRSFGFEVHTAYNVEGAIPILENCEPAAIVLDIMMPGVDGLTFVQHLRQRPRYAKVPIIISSAKYTAKDEGTALKSGANYFLPKPFSAGDLKQAIETVLKKESVIS